MNTSISSPFIGQPGLLAQQHTRTRSESAEQHLQDVFSAVLAQVGKQGFASAEPTDQSVPLQEAVASSWNDWFNEFSPRRYSFVSGSHSPSVREGKTADDLRSDYEKVLVAAYQNGGYANPQAYLKTLTPEDLATIQQVQHLAEPIQPDSLSAEAALNLLIPPAAQVDENNDGLTAVGAAYTLRFPDSHTPTDVRLAWEASIQDLPEEDVALHVMQMCMQLFTANMHFDEHGQYLGSSEPGDANWINPRASADFSFIEAADAWLEYLEQFAPKMPPEQFQRDFKFWSDFRRNLSQFCEHSS